MNKFIKRSTLSILILGLIYSTTVIIYNFFLEKEFANMPELKEPAQIIAIGDSHIECTIDDLQFPAFDNRARSAEIYYLNYCKLKSILSNDKNRKKQIKAICLSYHYFSLSLGHDNSFTSEKKLNFTIQNYTPIFSFTENYPAKFNLPISKSAISLLLASRLPRITDIRDILLYRKARLLLECKGSFLSSTAPPFRYNQTKLETALSNSIKKSPNNDNFESLISATQKKHLWMIAQLAKHYNIPLILVNAPLHKDYHALLPADYIKQYTSVANELHQEFGSLYLDYHDMSLPDSHFRDYDHLNPTGAAVFTPILLKDLRKHGLIE